MFSASLGEAQEQAPEAQEQTANQQEETQPLPIPLPVEIIESEESSQARQRSEEEARYREIEDLIAQQGMNAATQSIDAATQDMRDYALYSTLLVFVGTLLLFWTLRLTRQANSAALKSVEITEKMGRLQTQAYISLSDVNLHYTLSEDGLPVALTVRPLFTNTGNSPGKIVFGFCHIQFFPDLFTHVDYRVTGNKWNVMNLVVGPGESRRIDSPVVPIGLIMGQLQEGRFLSVIGRVEFTDVFEDVTRGSDFCVGIIFRSDPDKVRHGNPAGHDWNAHQDYKITVEIPPPSAQLGAFAT